MSHSKSYEFLLKDISILKKVGQKTKKTLKKKKLRIYLMCCYIYLRRLWIDLT